MVFPLLLDKKGAGVSDDAGAGAADPTLFYDTFTDANGTDLALHTPDTDVSGLAWNEDNGQWQISSNRAIAVTPDPGDWYATHDAEVADVIITTSVRVTLVNTVPEFPFRFTNASNLWRVQWAVGTNGTFAIYQVEAGVFTLRASTTKTGVADTDYEIQITINGQSVTATIDGGSEISYGSASFNQSATKHGIGMNTNSAAFNSYKIESINP